MTMRQVHILLEEIAQWNYRQIKMDAEIHGRKMLAGPPQKRARVNIEISNQTEENLRQLTERAMKRKQEEIKSRGRRR